MLAEPLSERNRGMERSKNVVQRNVCGAINVVRDKKVASVDYWQSGERTADERTK